MGGKSKPSESERIAGAASGLSQKAIAEFEALKGTDPSLADLTIEEFAKYYSAGDLTPEQLGNTSYEQVNEDPRYLRAKMQALTELEKRSREGLTPEERERIAMQRESALADEKAQQSSILQQAAERGNLDSGAQLAAQLVSSQQGAQRRLQQGRENASDINSARRDALNQMAATSAGYSQADLQRQAQLAQARDAQRQYDTSMRAQVQSSNLQNKQNIANQNVAQENQRLLQNIDAYQQQFQNRMGIAQGMAGATQNAANTMMQQAGVAGQYGAKPRPGIGQMAGTLGGMALGAYATGGSPQGAVAGSQAGGIAGGYADNLADGGIINAKDGYPSSQQSTSYADMQQADRQQIQNDQEADAIEKQKNQAIALKYMENLSSILAPKQEEKVAPMQAISPVQGAPMPQITNTGYMQKYGQAPKFADGGTLEELLHRYQGMKYGQGGMTHDGSGTVIPGDGEHFAGDKIKANVNQDEMILNVDQQDKVNKVFQEYNKLKSGTRVDDQLQAGSKSINPNQQEALMAVIRGELPSEQLPNEPLLIDSRPKIETNFAQGGVVDQLMSNPQVNDYEQLINDPSKILPGNRALIDEEKAKLEAAQLAAPQEQPMSMPVPAKLPATMPSEPPMSSPESSDPLNKMIEDVMANENKPTQPNNAYENLMKEYEATRGDLDKKRNTAEWADAISAISSNLGKAYGVNVGDPIKSAAGVPSNSDALKDILTKAQMQKALSPEANSSNNLMQMLRLKRQLNEDKADKEYREERLDLSKQSLDLSKASKKFAMLGKLNEATQGNRNTINAFNDLNNTIGFDLSKANIDTEKGTIKIDGKEQNITGMNIRGDQYSLTNPFKAGDINTIMQRIKNMSVYDSSGKQINESEMRRLEIALASGFKTEAQKFKAFQDFYKSSQKKLSDTLKTTPPEVREEWEKQMKQDAPDLFDLGRKESKSFDGMVKMMSPTGQVKMIPESQVEAAIKAGGTRIE